METDWFRLDRADRQTINDAVNLGREVVDPRLRMVAEAQARSLIRDSGWRLLRRPVVWIGLLLAGAAIILSGHPWLLVALLAVSAAALAAAEYRASQLRPHWERAAEANESTKGEGPAAT